MTHGTNPPNRLNPLRTALIVHPNLLTRRGLRHQLLRHGFTRAHEAEDGVDAATLVRQERLDGVFTPWSAGRLAGPRLFAALRPRGGKAAPAIVVLDEGLPQATVVAAVKAGTQGRLVLPATSEAVERVLAELSRAAEPPAPPRKSAKPGTPPQH